MTGRRPVPSSCGIRQDMHLRCANCRQTLTIPDSIGRYFEMPVRCHACRRVFSVPAQRPADRDSPSEPPQYRLSRSVSAQRHHHAIRCPACVTALRLPGQSCPARPVSLVCPACGTGFRHRQRADRVTALIWITGGAVLALGLVLLAHANGYIALGNLARTPALARLDAFLVALGLR